MTKAISKTRGALAGLGAGVLESVVAVTPFETIKTAMIDDRQSANPNTRASSRELLSLLRIRAFPESTEVLFPLP